MCRLDRPRVLRTLRQRQRLLHATRSTRAIVTLAARPAARWRQGIQTGGTRAWYTQTSKLHPRLEVPRDGSKRLLVRTAVAIEHHRRYDGGAGAGCGSSSGRGRGRGGGGWAALAVQRSRRRQR